MTDHLAAAVKAHKEALAAQQAMRDAAARREAAVRAAYESGVGVTEIANALNVHRSRVYQMIGKKP